MRKGNEAKRECKVESIEDTRDVDVLDVPHVRITKDAHCMD